MTNAPCSRNITGDLKQFSLCVSVKFLCTFWGDEQIMLQSTVTFPMRVFFFFNLTRCLNLHLNCINSVFRICFHYEFLSDSIHLRLFTSHITCILKRLYQLLIIWHRFNTMTGEIIFRRCLLWFHPLLVMARVMWRIRP